MHKLLLRLIQWCVWQDLWCGWSCDVVGLVMWLVLWCGWTFDVVGPLMWLVLWCGWSFFDMVGLLMWLVLWYGWSFDVVGPVMWLDLWCGWSFDVVGRFLIWLVFKKKKKKKEVYSFIKSQVTDRTCLQSKYKLYEIRPTGTARRLATQWVQEQPCKKINRKRKLQLNTVSLLRWRHICHESFRCWWESIPGSSHLGGEIVSHNTTDARCG